MGLCLLKGYVDTWLTSGHTKATRATKTKRTQWHWDDVHQTAYENIKTAIEQKIFIE